MRSTDPMKMVENISGVPFDEIPRSFELIGKSMIIRFKRDFEYDKVKLAIAFKKVFKLHAVYELIEIKGPMRIVNAKLLVGENIIERHKENGILFYLNPSMIMFSKGNKNERARIINYADKSKVVVDMFAGIGYYSLPVSRYSKEVHSIEINPDSFYFLILNRFYNGINNMKVYLMDCLDFPYEDIADLTIMGHFESLNYLEKAREITKDNGMILVHMLERRGVDNTSFFKNLNYEVKSKRMVKSYSPSLNHMVYEIQISK